MFAWISGWRPTRRSSADPGRASGRSSSCSSPSVDRLIGLERELQGKSAGIRTQTIVGTAAALILLVSKYGFSDVLVPGTVEVDPSRVAAQIVSGIGFLGAGIIIFRRGSVHGLTTAAAIWESAAIGMAAGAGLLLLACTVTAMHFLVVVGFMPWPMLGYGGNPDRVADRAGSSIGRVLTWAASGTDWRIDGVTLRQLD